MSTAGLPVAAIHRATRWVEENITPRRCDNEGVSDCWRCTTVALARWMEQALATTPSPERQEQEAVLDAERLYRAADRVKMMGGDRISRAGLTLADWQSIADQYASLSQSEQPKGEPQG